MKSASPRHYNPITLADYAIVLTNQSQSDLQIEENKSHRITARLYLLGGFNHHDAAFLSDIVRFNSRSYLI